MADQNFHEIQLSGKQLVFLFMAAVVASVGFFLLGVSVGKGVRGTSPASAQASVVGPETPTVTSPNATPSTTDLTYPNRLQGQPPGGSTTPVAGTPDPAPPAAAASPPAGTDQPVTPASKPTESKVSDAKPAQTKEPKATEPPATPPPSGGYSLQTGAFSTRSAAENLVTQLKEKKYPASVVVSPAGTPGPRFHVMVGPYPARADAQKVASSLQKDGYDAIIKR